MLGKVSTQIKENVEDKLDKNERAALISEFENWSDGQNPLLRKMCFMQMATNMNENEIQKLREMFIKIDEDQDGKISAEELYEFMNAMKAADPSGAESELSNSRLNDLEKVQAFIQEADQNQNNSIDYREFIAAQARR